MNKVLIDCRDCGGSGCRKCRDKGTRLVTPSRPAELQMPRDPAAFNEAREQCPCYEGFSINDGVMQCSHADARGEWCEVESCPALTPNAKVSGPEGGLPPKGRARP
jgi:hypothetical protein